ncbi:MAG: bifunctional folylpolyglutamate synthase/dihydrofolate synthase [Oscillospiraceae bacterium]|jgi:dihydrofolate synthase/folylpolyglutamate synthase|nr:bifunctional folylpolyglutamate synthase/dihydrofolate synthase [Oscillospiraceae bacterium]
MNYEQALSYIHSTTWRGSIPGLSRTRELLSRMGNPHEKLKFVHVAGTNGKGSTCAMLSSVLQAAGYRTGLYISPFIHRFNERMQINGEDIADDILAEITAFVQVHAEQMQEHPTEFELVTAIAMEFFLRQGCDIVVLEVGLGGRLDSTNVIPAPELAVICSIDFDHMQQLGSSLEEIAAEKAGIIKPGCEVALYPLAAHLAQVFEKKAAACNAPVHPALDAIGTGRSLDGQFFDCGARKKLFLPLLGAYQLKNAATVLAAVDALRTKGWQITERHLRQGLGAVRWQGRFELLRLDPLFFVDGGHNPQGIAALSQNLREYLRGKSITALTGVMADKDFDAMYRTIAPQIDRFVAVAPDIARALPAAALAGMLAQFGKPVTACGSVAQSVEEALAQTPQDGAVVAFGSLYMVGDIRQAVLSADE